MVMRMRQPNIEKKGFIKKHLHWGERVVFSHNKLDINNFQFFIENKKYYISNPLYRNYGIGIEFIKSQLLSGKILYNPGYKYIEIYKNDFYHLLWNMMRKCQECTIVECGSSTKIIVPMSGSSQWQKTN